MQKPLFTFLFTCIVGLTLAQTPRTYTLQEAGPEAAGFSAERLGRMDRVIQEYVDQKRIPGAVALVARHGKIIYYKGFGQDDVDAKTPLKRDAIFRVASQTKAVTSVAVMMLFEEGRFLLDDPVSKYLPAFKSPKVLDKFNEKDSSYTTVPAKSEITIRQLLTHTSGISYAGIGTKEANAIYAKAKVPSGIGTPNAKLADAMNMLGGLPLVHQPGEKWSYGLNTDVLGYLVEVLSGTTLDAFFRTRIFEPLGMKDTYFYLPKDRHNRLTALYTEKEDKSYQKRQAQGSQTPDYPKQAGTYYSGGAGLSSTAYDYAVFLQMLLNGGEYNGKRLLSPATVRMMTSNQIGELSLGLKKFGLGFGLVTEREAARMPVSEGSFEWGGIFGTTYWADPREGVVAMLYTQKFPNSYGDLADKFRVLVYQALTGTPPVAP
ncbi:MAG: Beta-lactamase class C-like and penicillin binding proteins (PBPs) superfamily [uncultured Cytophagales bacterium]|uniref:Beta-lactamase class C-like and penicillin binding proteins (PBPs) superfamily n=1 Tax=uncultured Cytophagales bacterium TaxID=158755 RepID=A0A6J4JCG0_9SPHI|nr:MAG: Beta-lactamase class C-like and penicillin binding proteins (PBPs) superfamily [uncultured Cytophagales bacterium]